MKNTSQIAALAKKFLAAYVIPIANLDCFHGPVASKHSGP
jgi:hypothetical protein